MLSSGLDSAARLFSLLLLRFRFFLFLVGRCGPLFLFGGQGGEGWSFRSCVEYTFGGSSLAEIHCTQDEPRVGIADWEQLLSSLLVCLGVVRYGIGLERSQLNRACLIGDGVEPRSIWAWVELLIVLGRH